MAVSSTMYDWEVLKSLELQFVQLNQITSVATFCGYDNNCALLLTQSGKVFAIGKSSRGCLGLGEVTETAEPVELVELSGVAGVCVCGNRGDALAYTSEGKVYVWGNNVSWKRPQLVPELTDVVDARCTSGHYLALTKSGKLYEWRGVETWFDEFAEFDEFNEFDVFDKFNEFDKFDELSTTPKVVTLNEVITSIACGPNHSFALTKDGQVYSWGINWNNGCINQPMTKIILPGETVAKITCGERHSLVLTHSGKLYTWGRNDWGLGHPIQVGQNIGRFVDIAVNGYWTNAAVSNTGAVYMWGAGENGAVKTPTVTDHLEMHQVFANISGNYSWTPKTLASNTVVVEDSSSVAGKLKASCNDEQNCNKAAIIEPDGQVQLNCNTLEQSQTNMDGNHAEAAKIHHLEEYVENLKKEFAKVRDELKEDNIKLKEDYVKFKEDYIKLKEDYVKFKDELKKEHVKLKEENVQLKEDNTIFKDELKGEIVKLVNKLKEDNANLKKDIAKLKDEPKGDNSKLRDEFKYPTTVVSPREQEEKVKYDEATITQPEERGLQLPVYLAQLEHDPTNVDSSNNIEEDNVNLRKELAKLQDRFKNLKALLFPQETERSSCEDNKDREIQRERRGRIMPTTASVTYKDNNQNKQRERSSCEDNREIRRGRRGRITPTTASVTYKDNNQNKQ